MTRTQIVDADRPVIVQALILEARVMASDCYPATAKLLTRLADVLERGDKWEHEIRIGEDGSEYRVVGPWLPIL